MDPATWPTAALAPIALAAILALWTLRRRRRARATAPPTPVPSAEVPERTPEDGAVVEPESGTEPAATMAPDPHAESGTAEVRALRMQVRSLEEALDRLPEAPVGPAPAAPVAPAPSASPAPPGTTTREVDAYRRHVRLTIRALAAHTSEGESPHRTLARVAAAIDRLEPADGLVRPALPPALHRVAPAVLAIEPDPDTLEPQPAVPVPAVEPFDVPELRRASAAEVVLPVPPPTPCPPKRKGRRLRRQAA